jgi:GNAT superfamily N-acetyltransferase
MEFIFRPIAETEKNSVERLLESARIPQAKQTGMDIDATNGHWLDAALTERRVYGGFIDGKLVSTAVTHLIDRSNLFIDHIAVLPDYQGRGIGGWTLSCIEMSARMEECTKLSFRTAAIMSELLHLCSRFGFHETRRGLTTATGNPHIQVHMEKVL